MTEICLQAAPLLSAATARIIIPATPMQPTPELTVQERQATSPRLRNVSRATIKNAVYCGGIFLSVVCVSSRDIHQNIFAPFPSLRRVSASMPRLRGLSVILSGSHQKIPSSCAYPFQTDKDTSLALSL